MKLRDFLKLIPALTFIRPSFGGDAPEGAWKFEVVDGWGALPDGKNPGPTHGGVAVDEKAGRVYISTDAEHSILVFGKDGSFVKSIAPECRGTHALTLREENGEAVLYGIQLAGPKPLRVIKLDTEGKLLLEISQATAGEIEGGWGGITAIAVAPDGAIFCSMGYGSQLIHKFDAAGKHLKTFGGRGNGDGLMNCAHGMAVDTRFGPPRLLVCDRENRRLVHFDLEGAWIGVHATGLRRPCTLSILGDACAVAELEGRVSVLDKDGSHLAAPGDNPDKEQWAKFPVPLDQMKPGVFTSPHGLSFDKDGNLYIQEWNQSGRVTKLKKV